MYYMDFGSAEEISVDTAAMGAEVGGGGGANINVIPKSRRQHAQGRRQSTASPARATGIGFTGNNITDDLRAQGITDPTLRKLNDFNAERRRPVHQGPAVVVRIVPQLHHGRSDAVLHGRQLRRQPDQPVQLEPAQLHGERQVSAEQEQPAVGVLDLQPEVPAEPRRRRRRSRCPIKARCTRNRRRT